MLDQEGKFKQLKALHQRDSAFVIPTPWDAGSARLLSSLEFEALATTSAGYALSKGKLGSFASLGRGEILENAAEIVQATDLPGCRAGNLCRDDPLGLPGRACRRIDRRRDRRSRQANL
jgi:2-methylisocitrate lyase-like PEP mutase family enzyme